MPVRKELGVRTVFNILGPLCNPAGTKRMVIGVYSEHLCAIMAEAANALGKKHVMVVHGMDGLDELTTTAKTLIRELRDGEIKEYLLDSTELGLPTAAPEEIIGGSPAENARIIEQVLSGREKGPKRDIVLLNAAAALVVAGKSTDWESGLALAAETVNSGRALEKLKALSATTRSISN